MVPLASPVFVIWRENKEENRKGRMVVDVRPLNDMIMADAYPMKTMDYIMSKAANATHITTFDAMAFYYQWRLHPDSQWAFTVVTTDGQYTFKCPIMGYKNCNAYVQRQMDNLLRGTAADSYCDDIVVASIGLDRHLADLDEVLTRLQDKNISLGPDKSFAGFPSAIVLGKVVDAFGMTTSEDKVRAIRALVFPKTLQALESFIGLAGSLRHHVPRYAAIAEPLEQRKTLLLREHRRRNPDGTPKTGAMAKPARKAWSTAINVLLPTAKEINAFEQLKTALTDKSTLAFFAPGRQLFIDFDACIEGIGVMVYHIAQDTLDKLLATTSGDISKIPYPPRTAIQPIAFLSRTLNDAEKRYWSTELEMCGCVWTISKTAH
ncbi:hypothetical protein CABS03_02268 [Colletotrichum abscissum]|uniref:Reverse transcriptase domain-containing protein n=1 Tax=Colletotrichum abscissum TaxID=1671311 RepID=A0A9P9X7L8_9PEZI|nr:hypothetical protein CABS02_10921 [Colletotrichum abscissum]